MPLWRLYCHVVFATRQRLPVLTPDLRVVAAALLAREVRDLGCVIHAVYVRPEHAHVVTSIPPRHAPATVIGRLKGSSSHALAQLRPELGFAWQAGYGVFSFGERHLRIVARYVLDQDRHHETTAHWPALERTGDPDADDGPPPYAAPGGAGPASG